MFLQNLTTHVYLDGFLHQYQYVDGKWFWFDEWDYKWAPSKNSGMWFIREAQAGYLKHREAYDEA